MAQLAIKGHADRGDEVIKLLEMMGGKNPYRNGGKYISNIYFINNEGNIEAVCNPLTMLDFTVLTLEEVEVLMPYKIGDKVLHEDEMCEIIGIKWNKYLKKIVYDAKSEKFTFSIFEPDKFKLVVKQENTHITMRPVVNTDGTLCYKIPKGYKPFSVQDGIIILKPIKLQYLKTYEECYEVLMGKTNFQDFALIPTKFSTTQYKEIEISSEPPHINLINNFYKLLICRDAYWKIAGEQMGLGKPWDSVYGCGEWGYWIGYDINENKIYCQDSRILLNHLLVFPTEEMRDAFYENFKDLIENCKELL